MLRERIKELMKVVRRLNSPAPKEVSSQSNIGYYDSNRTFQFSTFGTNLEKERILKELAANGANVIGIMTPEEASRLSKRQNSFSPQSSPFRDI